jgi:hypothetical protein
LTITEEKPPADRHYQPVQQPVKNNAQSFILNKWLDVLLPPNAYLSTCKVNITIQAGIGISQSTIFRRLPTHLII